MSTNIRIIILFIFNNRNHVQTIDMKEFLGNIPYPNLKKWRKKLKKIISKYTNNYISLMINVRILLKV